MNKNERLRLSLRIDAVQDWARRYREVTAGRDDLRDLAGEAAKLLLGRVTEIAIPDVSAPFAVLPLRESDVRPLGALARYVRLPVISEADLAATAQLATEVPEALREAEQAVAGGGMFRRGGLDDDVAEAAEFISDYWQWGRDEDVAAAIERLGVPAEDDLITPVIEPQQPGRLAQMAANAAQAQAKPYLAMPLAEALSAQVGLAALLARFGTPTMVDPSPFTSLQDKLSARRSHTSYGDSLDGALTEVDALEPFAAAVAPPTQALIVCAPEGHTADELVAYLRSVAA
ncbi:MAG: hypothetical protein FWG11_09670 [Promicromonosporaceae bacterium]|nr:hypothetical protein [Promicromonosporaceae bacterium]